jgi:hypothetical protein
MKVSITTRIADIHQNPTRVVGFVSNWKHQLNWLNTGKDDDMYFGIPLENAAHMQDRWFCQISVRIS